MRRIKSVGVVSLGKVMGMSGVLLGLLFGVIYGAIVIVVSLLGLANESDFAALGVVGGLAIMIVLPIGYGIAMFIGGLLYGLILNLVLGLAGGLEIEMD